MSADLEFRLGLPKLRVSTDRRIAPSQLEETTAGGGDSRDTTPIWTPQSGSESGGGDDECQTPTSAEHKIPATLSCPPAPKKPRLAGSCKRKLREFEFFEIVDREEIESFFRSSSGLIDVNSTGFVKRRCPCT